MPEKTPTGMNAKRLEIVALFLFPQAKNWKAKVAEIMEVHVTTVRRWVANNRIPPGYDKALECFAARKKEIQKDA